MKYLTPEQDKYLCTQYPILYQRRTLPVSKSNMGWGFECIPESWFPIIDELSKDLEATNAQVPPRDHIIAAQVKEKFGTFRFYLEAYEGTPSIFEVATLRIRQAERAIHNLGRAVAT